MTVTPTGDQLLKLSHLLRSQLKEKNTQFEVAFMLRQLHMAQTPTLPLPPPPQVIPTIPQPKPTFVPPDEPRSIDFNSNPPPSTKIVPSLLSAGPFLPPLRAEKWLWRLPAATAIHSLLRQHQTGSLPAASPFHRPATGTDPPPHPLSLAAKLALNALHWDVLLYGALLRTEHGERALNDPQVARAVPAKWRAAYTMAKAGSVELGLGEKIVLESRVTERARVGKAARGEQARERKWVERADYLWDRVDPLPSTSSLHLAQPTPPVDAPETVSPLCSLPTATLESLFVALSRRPTDGPAVDPEAALSLSFAMAALGRARSPVTMTSTFRICMDGGRRDLAARTWAQWTAASAGSATARRSAFGRLRNALRPLGKGWRPDPGRQTLAAVAHLVVALDEAWAGRDGAARRADHYNPLDDLVPLVASFPPGPTVREVEPATARAHRARVQAGVFDMSKNVMRRVLEDVTGRRIELGKGGVKLGEARAAGDRTRDLPLSVSAYNALIAYALRTLDSPELALGVLGQMRAQGLKPTAATQNVLLHLVRRSADSLVAAFDGRAGAADRTGPAVVRHLVKQADWDTLERVVFAALPELDLFPEATTAPPDGRHPTPAEVTSTTTFAPTSAADAPARPDFARPPPSAELEAEARSPWLYVTLLDALAKAGRTGLAERVFRNARWAAELSRRHKGPNEVREGWVLPPQAFVIMLQLYAAEARRGAQVAKQHDHAGAGAAPAASPFVAGWGRHALRVFLLEHKAAALRDRLGAAHDARSWRSKRAPGLPPVLRSEAAAIVARWELQGGSKSRELESLRRAMRSEWAEGALRALFPEEMGAGQAGSRRRESEGGAVRGGAGAVTERMRRRGRQMRRRAKERELGVRAADDW